MSEETEGRSARTPWHRLLARVLDLALTPVDITVETEFPVMADPPKVDILLLRRKSAQWTEAQRLLLPDGVRDATGQYTLLEFKYTESLTLDAFWQAIGYEYFFRTSRKLTPTEVQIFILCAKTPQTARLATFGFQEAEQRGVLRSENVYVQHVTLLLLNELVNEPHNAFVKAFASQQRARRNAFRLLNAIPDLSDRLMTFLNGLSTLWSLPQGVDMNEMITPERVMEIGEEVKKLLFQHLSNQELDAYLRPEYKQHVLEQGIEQGQKLGELQRARKIAREMLQRQFTPNIVSELTGLPLPTIRQIQKTLAHPTPPPKKK